MVVDLRELVVELMAHQGIEWAGRRPGRISLNRERKIPLEEAAVLFWPSLAKADAAAREMQLGGLRLFATLGMCGVVLETEVRRGKLVTSREAVRRFVKRLEQV
jgi:hypothetical protein